MIGVVLSLCGIGLVMVLSASAWTSLSEDGSVWTIFERQALWMGMGLIAFVATMRLDYKRWRKLRLPLGFLAYGMCVAVLIPGIGVDAGGSSRWIGIGQLRLQPSELMKLAVCVFGADLLTRREALLQRSRSVVVPLLSWLALACLLLIAQPDMGTAIVVTCITFSLLFAAGVPLKPIAKTVGTVTVLCAIAGFVEPYRRDRLLSFLNPFAHSQGTGYQVVQSLVGIGSGRLFGLGLGAGREKWGLLPNPHTDFIFSVIGEETGLIGALLVLGLFLFLGWLGLHAARSAPDRFAALSRGRDNAMDHEPGSYQHRRRDRCAAGYRDSTPVHLVRRFVFGDNARGGRHPREHRVARSIPESAVPPGAHRGLKMQRFALVAGGGTGGHTIPALAVARALEKERGPGSVELRRVASRSRRTDTGKHRDAGDAARRARVDPPAIGIGYRLQSRRNGRPRLCGGCVIASHRGAQTGGRSRCRWVRVCSPVAGGGTT